MGKMQVTLKANVGGPLADGSAHSAVNEWLDASKKAVAQRAEDLLGAYTMDKTGRATGHYQSMVRDRLIAYGDVIVDDPVVYGPWLEGTSKRNDSTRFKGYRLWRRTKQRVNKEAPQIAQAKLAEYAERIGITVKP